MANIFDSLPQAGPLQGTELLAVEQQGVIAYIMANSLFAPINVAANAHQFLGGPGAGPPAFPTFRSLVKADQTATTAYTDQGNTFQGPQSISVSPGTGGFSDPTGGNHCQRFGQSVLISSSLVGVNNVGFGDTVLPLCGIGTDNVGCGYNVMPLVTSASNNFGAGSNVFLSLSIGSQNVAVGSGSGNTVTTGNYNTFLGGATDVASSNISQSVCIGYAGVATQDNECAFARTINVQTGYGFTTQSRQRADFTDSWVDPTDLTRKAMRTSDAWDTAQRECWREWADGTAGRFAYSTPNSAPASAQVGNSQLSLWLDETGNSVRALGKYLSGAVHSFTLSTVTSVKDYGAKGDGQIVQDGAMSSGSAVLTSASGKFTVLDVGKIVVVYGAGSGGLNLSTTVLSWQSSTQVTLAAANASGGAVSGQQVIWGTNDTAAVQACITAVGATGGVVFFPNGIYTLGSGINVGYSNITLKGVGAGSLVISLQVLGNGDGYIVFAITTTGVSNWLMEDLKLQNVGTYSAAEAGAGLLYMSDQTTHLTNIRINRCNFTTTSRGAIDCGAAVDGFWVTDCRIDGSPEEAVYLAGGIISRAVVAHNVIVGTSVISGNVAISIRACQDSLIAYNHIENFALAAIDTRETTSQRLRIIGNSITNMPTANSTAINIANGTDMVVENNLIDGCTFGIVLNPTQGSPGRYTVQGNHINNCTLAVKLDGSVMKPVDVLIRNNAGYGCGEALYVGDVTDRIEVSDNFFPRATNSSPGLITANITSPHTVRIVRNRLEGYNANTLAGTPVEEPPSGGVRRQILSADLTLTAADHTKQHLDPNGSDRNVSMPSTGGAVLQVGHTFCINHVGSANTLNVKTSGGTLITAVTNGNWAEVVWDGTAWVAYT